MKFSWLSPDESGRMGVRAEPQHYDASPPSGRFLMDSTPLIFDSDLFMVAATLLFKPWVSGEVALSKAVSPAAAGGVKKYVGDPSLHLHPVDMEPRAIHRGSIRLYVASSADDTAPANAWGQSRWLTLHCERIDKASGVFATSDRIVIPTNGFLFSAGRGLSARLPELASAVLLSPTCQVDDIVMAGIPDDDPDLAGVIELLGAVGLGLTRAEEASEH